MKRKVKAWAVIAKGRMVDQFRNRRDAMGEAKAIRMYSGGDPYARVVPCTIEYDDGASAKQRKRGKAAR